VQIGDCRLADCGLGIGGLRIADWLISFTADFGGADLQFAINSFI
jgi:hypothetical protein